MTRHAVNNRLKRSPVPVGRVPNLTPDCDCFYPEQMVHGTWSATPLPLPVVYALELTPACSNRCPGCGNVFIQDTHTRSFSHHRPPNTIEQWIHVLDMIVPYAQRLTLTGGEPTLHPDFALIVQAVEQRALPFTLLTNGRWNDPTRTIAVLRNSTQCIGLLVSLHGADAQVHDAFTGVDGSFVETVAHIQRAVDAGLRVHTNTVLTRLNIHQVEAIVHLSHALGATCAVFNRSIGSSRLDVDCSSVDLRQALSTIDRLGRTAYTTRVGTCIPSCFATSSAAGCGAGSVFCTIDPWGNLRPCNHAPSPVGNVFDEPLETLWQSDGMQRWRGLIPDECIVCSASSACHGGCRADAVLQGLSRDPLIPVSGSSSPDCSSETVFL